MAEAVRLAQVPSERVRRPVAAASRVEPDLPVTAYSDHRRAVGRTGAAAGLVDRRVVTGNLAAAVGS